MIKDEDMEESEKSKLRSQIENEYGNVIYSYTVHLKEAKILECNNKCWKWAQIILSACSTASFIGIFFSDEKWISIVGTLISTLLVIINSYLKDLDKLYDAKSHLRSAKDLWLIKEDYISLLTDFDVYSTDIIRTKRDELLNKTSQIYREELNTSNSAYKKTRKALKEDDEQFFSQEELNRMLPKHLRKDE